MGSLFGKKKKEEPKFVPPPAPVEPAQDPEKLKRIGRSALIATSERGVLGNATVSGKKLS